MPMMASMVSIGRLSLRVRQWLRLLTVFVLGSLLLWSHLNLRSVVLKKIRGDRDVTVISSSAFVERTKKTSSIFNSSNADDGFGTSFFDCHHESSKCRYLYPGEFFHHYFRSLQRLKGHNHTSHERYGKRGDIDDAQYDEKSFMQWRKDVGLENANLPALYSLSWWWDTIYNSENDNIDTLTIHENSKGLENESTIDQQIHPQLQLRIGIPRNITYIHLHKCGGTSVQGALWKRSRRIRNYRFQASTERNMDIKKRNRLSKYFSVQMRSDVCSYKHSYGGGTPEKKEHWDKKRWSHIQAIANQQFSSSDRNLTTNNFPIFTIVRDPIERFFSAVQQVMHYNTDFRDKCLHDSQRSTWWKSSRKIEEDEAFARQKTIECAIDEMKQNHFRGDVHLLPMSSHFRLLDEVTSNDVGEEPARHLAVSVFSMEDIAHILDHISGGVKEKEKESSTIHARDRSDEEYATSPILAKLSISDCTEEMLENLCKLYHVDVALMEWLGYSGNAVQRCSL